MTTETLQTEIANIEAQIKSMEAQLLVLRAQVTRFRLSIPPRTFADLGGILAGQLDFTEEEIDAALYRFDWEGESADEMTG